MAIFSEKKKEKFCINDLMTHMEALKNKNKNQKEITSKQRGQEEILKLGAETNDRSNNTKMDGMKSWSFGKIQQSWQILSKIPEDGKKNLKIKKTSDENDKAVTNTE